MNRFDMVLDKTCDMCPEQYDVYDVQGNRIAYMRLRYGYFSVECPYVGGTVVFATYTRGDGCFYDEEERNILISAAKLEIAKYYIRKEIKEKEL